MKEVSTSTPKFFNLFSFLSLNEKFLTFSEFYEGVKKRINPDSIEIEIETKLEKRILLTQIGSVQDNPIKVQDMLARSSIDSQVLRSRFTFLRNECYKYAKKLEDYSNSLKKYLVIEYRLQLEQMGIKTQTDKTEPP